MAERRIFKPQPGKQEMFLRSSADICIYGGAAGGGKTYALLLEPCYHLGNPGFEAVILRQQSVQITATGGLWDSSMDIYPFLDGTPVKTPRMYWKFPSGAKVSFSHLSRESELYAFQGSQIPLLCFDELTHWNERMFFYMLSRNRSTCGVKPYVRCTCNPDADSWVARFISWWIDQDTGYPIPERCGKIRWFLRKDAGFYWADKPEDLWNQFDLRTQEDRKKLKSVSFISSTLADNQILMKADPSYLANLEALPTVERERLLNGNWKIRAASGLFFKRAQVLMTELPPSDLVTVCRAWDIAATEERPGGDPDYTAGVLMAVRKDRTYVVLDVINQRIKAGDVERLIYNTAVMDRKKYGGRYRVYIPQDPGAAGKIVVASYIKTLAGFSVKTAPVTGSKENRATPLAAQWQNGNVAVLAAPWNEAYFSQMEGFPEGKFDDMVDASSDAFNVVANSTFSISSLL